MLRKPLVDLPPVVGRRVERHQLYYRGGKKSGGSGKKPFSNELKAANPRLVNPNIYLTRL